MEWLVLLAIVLVAIVVLRVSQLARRGRSADNYPYTRNDVLFSAAERSFFGVLEQAVGDEYRVFGKVRVADVASVKAMGDRAAWQRAFNRISSKHFDFLLCAKNELSIKAAVELNDKSHGSRKRQERDQFLIELCRSTSLPLISVPAQQTYSVAELREKVLAAVAGEAPTTSEPMLQDEDAPLCPKCSAPMVRRLAKKGANAGQEFWGCTAYPKCRGVVARQA